MFFAYIYQKRALHINLPKENKNRPPLLVYLSFLFHTHTGYRDKKKEFRVL